MKEGDSLKRGVPRWRRSADRASLHVISLLSGNLTGNFANLWHLAALLEQEITVPQGLFVNSQCKLTGKMFSRSGSFYRPTGISVGRQHPSLASLFAKITGAICPCSFRRKRNERCPKISCQQKGGLDSGFGVLLS
jgi:hypothetical protein